MDNLGKFSFLGEKNRKIEFSVCKDQKHFNFN
jgi:hypothetical protein